MKTSAAAPAADDIRAGILAMGEKARFASRHLATLSTDAKNRLLTAMAEELETESAAIIEANARDLENAAAAGLSAAMIDRLRLDAKRIHAMANGLRDVAALEDPVGRVLASWIRPNGLAIEKISVPIGVIGIIYESRPNVTVDAAGLCLKAGNAVILRGGSEAINSNLALAHCLNRAGLGHGLPDGAVGLVPWTDRVAVSAMLRLDTHIDLIMPRGGEALIRTVVEQSTIPVIKHYKGVCHIFVDAECDFDRALAITENAKCQRPGVCNAVETLLIHADIAPRFAPAIAERLLACGCELRGDDAFRKLVPVAKPASEEDWFAEYLDLILAIRIVPDLATAIDHINEYGSHHSDAILTANQHNAERFLAEVDSAVVYVNASTRFTDGGQFGMGAEIGISTDKLHARGPMALPELTTYKYKVRGDGQVRE
jgi:glutamate-5-semialdehyde dehydrogenase